MIKEKTDTSSKKSSASLSVFLLYLLCMVTFALGGCGKTKQQYVKKGETFLSKKEYNTAIIEFKCAMKIDPDDYQVKLKLAESYFHAGKPDNAERELDQVIKKRPDISQAHFLLSSVYLARQDNSNALKEAKLALELNKKNERNKEQNQNRNEGQNNKLDNKQNEETRLQKSKIHNLLALIYMQMKEYHLAKLHFDNALELDPANIEIIINQGCLYMDMKNYVDAKEKFEKARDLSPHDPKPYMALGKYYYSLKEYEKAEPLYKKLLDIDPASFEAMTVLGDIFNRQNKFDEAIKQGSLIIKKYQKQPYGYHIRGEAYYAKGQYKEAVTDLQKAATINPDGLNASYLLGLAYYKIGQKDQSISSLQNVIRINPDHIGAHALLAATNLEMKRYEVAMQEAQKGLNLSTNNPYLHNLLGLAYIAQNQLDKGMDELQLAVQSDPNFAMTYQNLANLYQMTGKKDDAIKAYESAIKIDPQKLDSYPPLVLAYLDQNAPDQALGLCSDALKSESGPQEVYYNLMGLAYVKKGTFDKARESMNKSLSINPNFFTAQYNLANLDIREGNTNQAIARYESILEQDTKNIRALSGLTEIYAKTGDKQKQISSLKKILRIDPKHKGAFTMLAQLQFKEGNFKSVIELAKQFTSAVPGSNIASNILGAAYLGTKEYDLAIEEFKKAVQMNPKDLLAQERLINAYTLNKEHDKAKAVLDNTISNSKKPEDVSAFLSDLGLHALSSGDSKKALEYLNRALKENPDNEKNYLKLFAAYTELKEPDLALGALKKGVEKLPRSINLRVNLANGYVKLNKPDEGLKQYQYILENLDSKNSYAYHLMGDTYMMLNNESKAEDSYKKAIQSNPKNIMAYNNLAWFYANKGVNLDQSLILAQKADSLSPNNPFVLDTIGMIYLKLNKLDRSIESLKQASALDKSNHPSIQYHLASALYRDGKKEQALAELNQVLSKQTEFPEKKEAEQLLKEATK